MVKMIDDSFQALIAGKSGDPNNLKRQADVEEIEASS